MKKSTRKKVLLGAATIAAVSAVARDAYAAKDTLDINAKIIAQIKITATQALDFGSATVAAGSAGTVTVTNAGVRTAGGGVSLIGGAVGQPGGFTIKAAKGLAFDVSLPKTATLSNGTKTMKVTDFTISGKIAIPTGNTFVGSHTAAVTKTGYDVGGVLKVAAGQATGTYTGTAVLTAAYQ